MFISIWTHACLRHAWLGSIYYFICCWLNPKVGVRFLLLMTILFLRMFMVHAFICIVNSVIIFIIIGIYFVSYRINTMQLFFIFCFLVWNTLLIGRSCSIMHVFYNNKNCLCYNLFSMNCAKIWGLSDQSGRLQSKNASRGPFCPPRAK